MDYAPLSERNALLWRPVNYNLADEVSNTATWIQYSTVPSYYATWSTHLNHVAVGDPGV